MTTGEKIKIYRKINKWTQKELAEKLGLSDVRIRQYEHNYRIPKKEQLQMIADVLGCNIANLISTETYNILHAEEYIKDIINENGKYFVAKILTDLINTDKDQILKDLCNKDEEFEMSNRLRNKQIIVRVTDEEFKILNDKAEYVCMNASEFIRKIIISDNVVKLPVDEIRETSKAINDYRYEINKIGNNINQLVKIIHENNDLYFDEQIQEAVNLIDNVGKTFDELTKVMYEKLYNL